MKYVAEYFQPIILQRIGRDAIEIHCDVIKPMTSQEIGRDPIKYAATNFWPIMYYEIGRDLAIIGRDIIQTNRITNNWLRYDYDYITSNHN